MREELPALPSAEQLFDEFPCGLVVTSTRGTILKANQTLCAWLGWTREELVERKKLQELFTMGGRIFHQTHWVPMLQMQGSLSEIKFDLVHRRGHTLPMMLNAKRSNAHAGEIFEVCLTVAEERNKYEKELLFARNRADELVRHERAAQRLIEAAQSRLQQAVRVGNLFLWDVDPDTKVRRYDPEVARLLGRAEAGRVDEEAFRSAIAPEDAAGESDAFDTALREPGHVHAWTHRLNGQDGVQRVVTASGRAILGEDGSVSQFVGVLSDVTESVRQRAYAEDRAKFAEQMVGIVSHDLRNPLSAIVTGAYVLGMGGDLPERKSMALARVVSSAQRARRLIDELLDFTLARVGRGLSVDRIPLELHAVVAKIVDELGPAFPGRTLQHGSVGSGECTADPDRIAQLIGNLVGNAMAHGAADRPVKVTSRLGEGRASVTVHNEGVPIPPELLATIFEPMVRGATENNAARSVGLGLYIVRAIAQAHSGEIKVRSGRGEGTAFEFTFPAWPAATSSAGRPSH